MSPTMNWPALMRAGMCELGLRPDTFWALTPAELTFLLTAGGAAKPAISRSDLAGLMARYPDTPATGGSDAGDQ